MVEGTPAARFAIEHAHYTDDLAFWCDLADEVGSPVLDLGAAAGRVSCALADRGHSVVAVDVEPEMLAQIDRAIAEAPHRGALIATHCADMRHLKLDRIFPLILIPMNTLQAFTAPADVDQVFARLRHHLAPAGVFAFDVVLPDLDVMREIAGQEFPGARYDAPTGETLRHRSRFDAVDRTSGNVTFTTLIDESHPERGTTTHVREHHVHLFTPSEMWDHIARAGMEVQAVYGDFDGSPLSADSERQVYRCGVPT